MPFQIVRNDITAMKVDAIVNAANSQLAMGGGVCGGIFKKAGARRMKRACDEIGGCQTGRAVYTPAFDLDAQYVIHAVGPVWEGGNADEEELLYSAYTQALRTAASLGVKSIALPLISAGSFGYPVDQAYLVAVSAIQEFLNKHDIMVYLVVFSNAATQIARDVPEGLQEFIDSTYVDEAEAEDERIFQRGRHSRMVYRDEKETTGELYSLEEAPCMASFDAPREDPYDASFAEAAAAMPAPCAAPAAKPTGTSTARHAKHSGFPFLGSHAKREEAREDMREEALPMAQFEAQEPMMSFGGAPSLDDVLKNLDESFSATLLRLIDERNLSDAAVYKRANISRQLFAKIRKDDGYRPSKPTVLALAVALEMGLEDAEALLKRAGFSLSHSSKFDVIVEYFLRRGEYDIFAINEALYAYDQPLLGSASM